MENEAEHLKVAIRVRPLLEIDRTSDSIVSVKNGCEVTVLDSDHYVTSTFDKVFDTGSSQVEVFDYISPALEQTLKGFNCTIFAYGQTGTGKTFTMFGDSSYHNKGLIPNSIEKIFQDSSDKKLTFYCSFIQIYNEQLYDLLQDPKRDKMLRIRENKLYGIFVEGLAEFVVESADDCYLLINKGESSRAVRQTRFNYQSSRSHTIFQVMIESDKANKRGVMKKAKINFCDLAGSEKYDKDNKMIVEHVKELTQINKSLSTLGKVIHALGSGTTTHIPYRDSKLTRLLQDSLGVSTRTILIATISPVPNFIEETISTLKFADRAKQVMVKIKKNEISATNDQLITKLQREIQHLKTLLNLKRKGGIHELEQKIWVLTEENQKLKTIKQVLSVEEVERLKEENKRLRLELQNLGTQGGSDGFFVGPIEDDVQAIETPKKPGSRSSSSKPLNSLHSSISNFTGKTASKPEFIKSSPLSDFCRLCKAPTPCIHSLKSSPYMPNSPFTKPPTYRSYASSGTHSTPTHKSPEIPKRMNIRYRMTNCVVEDPGISEEIKEAEARKKEMRNIQARLNKISEIENYRKEMFRKELRVLEENKKKEDENIKRNYMENLKRKKEIEEKKKMVEEFKKNKKMYEEIEQMKAQIEKREAENKKKIENEIKKKKIEEYRKNAKKEESYE